MAKKIRPILGPIQGYTAYVGKNAAPSLIDKLEKLFDVVTEARRENRASVIVDTDTLSAILALAKESIDREPIDGVEVWEQLHPKATEHHAGLIPSFVTGGDIRGLREQINERYTAGGWNPASHGRYRYDPKTHVLTYPGDPPFPGLWRFKLRDEELIIFPHGIVMVRDLKTGEFEVSRLD